MILVTPGVGQYIRYMNVLSAKGRERKRAELNLAGASFVAVAHDRRNTATPIRDSLDLVDTAAPGASEMDIVATDDNKIDDLDHFEHMILTTFQHGWHRLAREEGANFITREDGQVEVDMNFDFVNDDEMFFKAGTFTNWLDQEDLRLLAASHDKV
eukprot:Blabericola_migrator_1__413@NODE_10_length_25093_cov_104_131184_g7_i2_p19_GENE_NODE_10_length_25093_cov_104_131184_g7_i2NODE_10_length_25093_cov_104_131184_g7_i2_p19_ORF_typecomplete_len156_score25_61_NODE_10_length_25093_cov_104_131184_g7_i22150921976